MITQYKNSECFQHKGWLMLEALRQEITQALVAVVLKRAKNGSLNKDGITVKVADLHERASLLSEPDLTSIAHAAIAALREQSVFVGVKQYKEKIFIVSPQDTIPQPRCR